jgi:hypothetical protein
MRSKVLQILWHNKDPVYSLDFHPNGMLATAGQDKEVMVRHAEKSTMYTAQSYNELSEQCVTVRLGSRQQ